jgi:hypothetical protein
LTKQITVVPLGDSNYEFLLKIEASKNKKAFVINKGLYKYTLLHYEINP